jgi:hypothetical protein
MVTLVSLSPAPTLEDEMTEAETVETGIAQLKARLASIDTMLGGDISARQRRDLTEDWRRTYKRLSQLQNGEAG